MPNSAPANKPGHQGKHGVDGFGAYAKAIRANGPGAAGQLAGQALQGALHAGVNARQTIAHAGQDGLCWLGGGSALRAGAVQGFDAAGQIGQPTRATAVPPAVRPRRRRWRAPGPALRTRPAAGPPGR